MPKIIYRVDIYYTEDGEFYNCIETTSEITADYSIEYLKK